MEITTTTIEQTSPRRATVNALAIVGFIALLFIGVALAIYGARYVPTIVSRVGSAAVSLSQSFRAAEKPAALEVVTATSTLPFSVPGVVTATTSASTTVAAVTASLPTTGTTAGTKTSTTYTTVSTPVAPYGQPDLTIAITNIGYLSDSSSDSFITSGTVPSGKRGAVKFVVTNSGTNYTGTWQFGAYIQTSPIFSFVSPTQQSLAPNDRIEYVLGFDQVSNTPDRVISITVDSNNALLESNESNNTATVAVARAQ